MVKLEILLNLANKPTYINNTWKTEEQKTEALAGWLLFLDAMLENVSFFNCRFELGFIDLNMGYTLKIGQAVKRYDNERRMDQINCEKIFLKEAPAFGELTDHTNVRMPSYSIWEIFAEEVGLYNFFFDKEMGLLNGADGVFPLTQAHKEVIDAACAAYVERYPFVFSVKAIDSLIEENFHFERLRWLKFWTDWALTNCDTPIFLNEQ